MNEQKFDAIKLRLLEFAEKQQIPKGKFYTKISVRQSNFGGKSLESSLSSAKIAEILIIFPEINPDWLLTGQGEMLRPSNNQPSATSQTTDNDHVQALIDILNRSLTEKDKQIDRLLTVISNLSQKQ